jgi:predicted metal-binding membrane protein
VRSPPAVAALPRRDVAIITSCILGVTILACTYLVHLSRQMSSPPMAAMGMTMGASWSAVDVFFTFVMWAVMMVGMMSASAAPALLLFAEIQARHVRSGVPVAVLLFGLGYLTIWLVFSAAAALAQWGLHTTALLSPTMATSSARLAGAILIAAGVYQLTPVKRSCLRHCQSPLGFLLSHWRDGARGALHMGLRHGIYCLGCCWALMCILFAVGSMNLVWVAVLTAFILLEKTGRAGGATRFGGIVMVALGIFVAAR